MLVLNVLTDMLQQDSLEFDSLAPLECFWHISRHFMVSSKRCVVCGLVLGYKMDDKADDNGNVTRSDDAEVSITSAYA